MKKKISYALLGLAVIATIGIAASKPSLKDFKEYSADFTTTKRKVVYRKIANNLFYAVYEKQIWEYNNYDKEFEKKETLRYVGQFMNFKLIE